MAFKPLKSLEVYLQSLIAAKLWVKIIVAIILGIGAGMTLSPATGWVPENISVPVGAWLGLPGQLFMKLVQMIMIPLIFASIITGIVSASGEQLKKMGLGVAIYFVITTIISIALGVMLALIIQPGIYMQEQLSESQKKEVEFQQVTEEESAATTPTMNDIPNAISELLPENPLAAMVSGEMLAIVIFTIIIGISVIQLSEAMRNPIMHMLSAIQEICMTIVKWAMLLVPYAVFGLMAQLMSSIGISSLKGIGLYMATVLAGLALLIVVYMIIVSTLGRQNPFTFLKKIREVQLLAFSTSSSAAVMPLSIKTAEDELGVDKSVSNFLIPVGATVNMDGTSIYQCISTLFIMQAYGVDINMGNTVLIMFTIVAASIGTPAIPGGGVIILASVLQGAGVPAEGIVLIIGVDRILGMFRTAINVTGDLAACTVFDRMTKKWDKTITDA